MSQSRTIEELTSALERQFAIDDYLELRARFPKEEDTALWMIIGSTSGGISFGLDFAFLVEADFKKFGIPIEYYLGTLDGDSDYIDLLCLSVLEALSRREKLVKEKPHTVASGHAKVMLLSIFYVGRFWSVYPTTMNRRHTHFRF